MRIAMRHRLLMLSLTLFFLPALARAQSVSDAQAFVLKLYQAYAHGSPDYLGHNATQIFSAPLLKLIQRDAAQTKPGEIGALDGDPICDCQDSAGFSDLDVTVVAGGKDRARADVRFVIAATAVAVSLDLVAVHGQWRVDDVHTPDMPSLVALLQQDTRATPASGAN
jgi:Protein of unknown function (DUF3828)